MIKDLHKETLYEFPCDFGLKAMGKNSDIFIDTVFDITQQHIPKLSKEQISYKYSKGEKYISVNIKFTATSLDQLHAIYADFKSHPDILMAL